MTALNVFFIAKVITKRQWEGDKISKVDLNWLRHIMTLQPFNSHLIPVAPYSAHCVGPLAPGSLLRLSAGMLYVSTPSPLYPSKKYKAMLVNSTLHLVKSKTFKLHSDSKVTSTAKSLFDFSNMSYHLIYCCWGKTVMWNLSVFTVKGFQRMATIQLRKREKLRLISPVVCLMRRKATFRCLLLPSSSPRR